MSRPTTPTRELLSNFEGFLKKFKLTKESHKDQEVLTLANLDSGRIRKFIVKKVDERSLFRRSNSQKSLKDENENKSKKSSSRNGSIRKKTQSPRQYDGKRRTSSSSIQSLKSVCSLKRFGSRQSINSNKSTASKKRRRAALNARFKLGWGGSSSSESELDDAFEFGNKDMIAKDRDDEIKDDDDQGFINEALVKDYEDEGVEMGKEGTKDDMDLLEKNGEDDSKKNGGDFTDSGSLSSLESSSPPSSPRFKLKMSPIPKRSNKKKSEDRSHSPVSFRSGYQSNRSSISSVRKGILKKTNSSTTINMEMSNISRPHTPTEDGSDPFDETYANGDSSRFCRSADNPHLKHQRSFNRVKFILDSGRPDNITGDYDDIKMENKNDKLDRDKKPNEKLQQKGLSRGGKKCVVFTAGLLIMTMAVILGSFFGSRKSGLPKASANSGANANNYIDNAVEGRFKITNENFQTILYDYESPEFKRMTIALEDVMVKEIFTEESANQANSTIRLRVVKFEKASASLLTVAVFRIKWEKTVVLELSEIRRRILRYLALRGGFGEYNVDKSTFTISELIDFCGGEQYKCSHLCVLSENTLRFGCTCPDNLIAFNSTECIPPALTTTTMKNPVRIPEIINKVLKVSNATLLVVNQETVTKEEKIAQERAPAKNETKTAEKKESELETDKKETDRSEPEKQPESKEAPPTKDKDKVEESVVDEPPKVIEENGTAPSNKSKEKQDSSDVKTDTDTKSEHPTDKEKPIKVDKSEAEKKSTDENIVLDTKPITDENATKVNKTKETLENKEEEVLDKKQPVDAKTEGEQPTKEATTETDETPTEKKDDEQTGKDKPEEEKSAEKSPSMEEEVDADIDLITDLAEDVETSTQAVFEIEGKEITEPKDVTDTTDVSDRQFTEDIIFTADDELPELVTEISLNDYITDVDNVTETEDDINIYTSVIQEDDSLSNETVSIVPSDTKTENVEPATQYEVVSYSENSTSPEVEIVSLDSPQDTVHEIVNAVNKTTEQTIVMTDGTEETLADTVTKTETTTNSTEPEVTETTVGHVTPVKNVSLIKQTDTTSDLSEGSDTKATSSRDVTFQDNFEKADTTKVKQMEDTQTPNTTLESDVFLTVDPGQNEVSQGKPDGSSDSTSIIPENNTHTDSTLDTSKSTTKASVTTVTHYVLSSLENKTTTAKPPDESLLPEVTSVTDSSSTISKDNVKQVTPVNDTTAPNTLQTDLKDHQIPSTPPSSPSSQSPSQGTSSTPSTTLPPKKIIEHQPLPTSTPVNRENLKPNKTQIYPRKEISTVQGIPLHAVTKQIPTTDKSLLVSSLSSETVSTSTATPVQSEKPVETSQSHVGLSSNVSHDIKIPVSQPTPQNVGDEIKQINSSIGNAVNATSSTLSTILLSSTTTPTTTTLPSCKQDDFQCSDGFCIPKEARCDSVYDCFDRSDEADCLKNKCLDNYQCRWSGDCLARKLVCDGVNHCTDGDDEVGCETWNCKDDEFRCSLGSMSRCIPLKWKCDGHPDCFNQTDELNCTTECPKDHFFCPEGSCIPNLWKCDGRSDCLGGEDEKDCECEGLDQSSCDVGGCVPTFNLCDGLRQCPDGSDEWDCLKIENDTKQLQVRSSEGRWSAVCGDKWTAQWTDLVCEQLGFGFSLSTEVRRVPESVLRPRVSLSPDATEVFRRRRAPLQYYLAHSECSSDPLVHVSCKMPECGKWNISTSELLGHSLRNSDEPWPSLGLLIQPEDIPESQMSYSHACAASIITPTWVLTSYSCLTLRASGLETKKWALLVGEYSPKAGEGNTQLRYTRQMVVYPGAKRLGKLWIGDAALLRLETPLTFDPSVQPICLAEEPAASHDQCVVATWKAFKSKNEQGVEERRNQTLQNLPIPNLTLNTCNTSYYNGQLSKEHTCASFLQDKNSPCSGNESAPLMCRNKNGAWQLHGLLSYTGSCASYNLPSVFTDVSTIHSWLLSTIGRPASSGTITTTAPSTTTTTTTTTITTTTTAPSSSTTSSTKVIAPSVTITTSTIVSSSSPKKQTDDVQPNDGAKSLISSSIESVSSQSLTGLLSPHSSISSPSPQSSSIDSLSQQTETDSTGQQESNLDTEISQADSLVHTITDISETT